MEASSVSSAVQTTAAATPTTSIGFTLMKLVIVVSLIAMAYYLLTKDKHDKEKVRKVLQDAARKFKEGSETLKVTSDGAAEEVRSGYGRYLLNLLLDDRRIVVPLCDFSLAPGEAILINQTGVDESHNPYIKETVGVGHYSAKAKELRGENPILLLRSARNNEMYLKFDKENTVFFQLNAESEPVEIDPAGKSFKVKDISEYMNESYFFVSGVPMCISLNRKYVRADGKIDPIRIKDADRGLSYVDAEKIPDYTPNAKKSPKSKKAAGPFSD